MFIEGIILSNILIHFKETGIIPSNKNPWLIIVQQLCAFAHVSQYCMCAIHQLCFEELFTQDSNKMSTFVARVRTQYHIQHLRRGAAA